MDFNKIIQTNKQNVRNIIRLITKEDNEDIEQEVYVKVWKNADKYKEQGSVKSWINTIAKNTSLDYLKSTYYKICQSSTNDDYTLSTIGDKKVSPEENVINLERRKKILKAIDSLKPKLREVIMLCEVQDYSYEECAKKLKCPVGTVKSRIFNAKKELAQNLEDLL